MRQILCKSVVNQGYFGWDPSTLDNFLEYLVDHTLQIRIYCEITVKTHEKTVNLKYSDLPCTNIYHTKYSAEM